MSKEYIVPAIVSNEYDSGKLWVVNFPGFRGCWVEGASRNDVITRAPKVLKEYLDYLIENSGKIPDIMDIEEMKKANIGEVIEVKFFL